MDCRRALVDLLLLSSMCFVRESKYRRRTLLASPSELHCCEAAEFYKAAVQYLTRSQSKCSSPGHHFTAFWLKFSRSSVHVNADAIFGEPPNLSFKARKLFHSVVSQS